MDSLSSLRSITFQEPGKKIPAGFLSIALFSLITWIGVKSIDAQTSFTAGEIMFTGYVSDAPNEFSFVLLKDAVSGTELYITDRGWSSTTGFRDDNSGEGTVKLVLNVNLLCGTTIIFKDVGGTNDWIATDGFGIGIGTVTILTSTGESPSQDPDGIELTTDGDQLFIYQLPEPNPSNQSGFITGIHMNGGAWNAGNGDDFSSQKPSGLANSQVVRFNVEYDNAKYDCSPNEGSTSTLLAAISNDNGAGGLKSDGSNNWQESNNWIDMYEGCSFCCGTSTPPLPELIAPPQVVPNQQFTIQINGTLSPGESWQLFEHGCGNGSPLQTTTGSTFTIQAPGSVGNLAYYIKGTQDGNCNCSEVQICVVTSLTSVCTNCTSPTEECGICQLPDPYHNPELNAGCFGMKLVFVLDESGSIGSNAVDVKNGVLAFLNALDDQNMQIAIIEFSSEARIVSQYTTLNEAFVAQVNGYFNGIPLNGQTYFPFGGTNWHDAMLKADGLDNPDLLLFFTDGIPTGYGTTFTDCSNGTTTETPEIVNPVKLANKMKSEGTHIFMLGVGNTIPEENFVSMSGPIEYDNANNTIADSDWSIGEFQTLAADLLQIVKDLCRTTVEVRKEVTGPACNGVLEFRFVVKNTGTQSSTGNIILTDTFPDGYTNLSYSGPGGLKLCPFIIPCAMPPNGIWWGIPFVPPGDSVVLLINAEIVPGGNHVNVVWIKPENADITSDTFPGTNLTDNLPPQIECPPDVSVSCMSSTLPPITGVAIATDPDGTIPDITYDDITIAGNCPQEYTIQRTFTATDACNNTATCVQIIEVNDFLGPIISCPVNVTINCNESSLPANTGTVQASDDCNESVTTSYTDQIIPGGCAQEYTIQRTWQAQDACGNTNSCVQSIVVVDNEGPSIVCPPNITLTCNSNFDPSLTGFATGADGCDSNPMITYSDVESGTPCSQSFVITRTWKIQDACGSFTTCVQTIMLNDEIAPEITCPPAITIQCTAGTLPGTTGSPIATDNCDMSLAVTYTDVTMNGSCPQEYSILRTWKAEDDCGNFSTCEQTITVDDSNAPQLMCPPNVTLECDDDHSPAGAGTASAMDNCDASPQVSYSDVSVTGSCADEMIITRTWTSIDACGNSVSCQQLISVIDNTAPVINCPPAITIACGTSSEPSITGSPVSDDNCDVAPALNHNDVTMAGSCSYSYTIQRTWISTDDCGNGATCLQIITVQDIISPEIDCPADITIECIDDNSPANTGAGTATDNCDPAPMLAHSDATISGPSPNDYTIHRTWTATDICGNSATCLQVITVINPIILTPIPFDTVCSGESVTFNIVDLGLNGAAYSWTFGSGSSPSGGAGLGPHIVTYNHNGTNGSIGADVTLTVTLDGCPTVTETISNVHVNAIPNSAIDAPATNLCYFRDRSFKPVASEMAGFTYQWTFSDDASIPSANTYGPHDVQWSVPGMKIVTLIVSSHETGASCSDTTSIIVNVINCPGNITGRVRRPDGTGIASVNVRLFPDNDLDGLPDDVPPIRNVFTTTAGVYSMVGLLPGQYCIVEYDLAGYFSLMDLDESEDNDLMVYSDPNDNILPVTIEPQEIDADNVFVDVSSPGSITGYVFEDLNNNGQPDASEGIPNVVITLHADDDINGIADGPAIQTVNTTPIGFFTFGGLETGHFVIVEAQPAGYTNVSDIDFTNDNDAVPNTNTMNDTIPVSIVNNEIDAQNYFKESKACSQVVTNANDSGPGSLRAMINCTGEGDTITFHIDLANQTIHLTSARLIIDKDLTILNTIVPPVTIQSDISGAIVVSEDNVVELRNVKLVSGLPGHLGAAIENYGHLTLWDVIVRRNPGLPLGNYLIYNSAPGTMTTKGSTQIETD